MKKVIFALIFVMGIVPCLLAQETQPDENQKKYRGTHHHFDIDLGMNNFLEDGKNPSGEPYEVKPWGSWYIALKGVNNTQLGKTFHLLWGPEVSFYSFKFQDESVRLIRDDDGVEFVSEDIPFASKSKLEVIYLGMSLVPMFQFGDKHGHHHWHDGNFSVGASKGGFRIGVGGYAGYRLGSKMKYVVKDDGKNKAKDHDNFFLNNWRYGVRMQMGVKQVDVFFNYDLNDLFTEGRGPSLNAFSFGVVL